MIIVNIIVAILAISIIVFLLTKIRSKNNEIYCLEQNFSRQTKDLKNQIKKTNNLYQKRIFNLSQDCEKRIKQAQVDAKNYVNETKLVLKAEQQKTEQLQKKIDDTKCIICNKNSYGKHFCFSCYSKFKNQSFDVRIKNCQETEIIDYYGNKTFLCDDGRFVRSRAEALISNFLFNNKIRYIYEKPIYYRENDINKVLHPDFYLPDYNLYIEYNELNTDKYTQAKEYAMRIYKQKGLKILVMTDKDLFNIPAFLMPKLEK